MSSRKPRASSPARAATTSVVDAVDASAAPASLNASPLVEDTSAADFVPARLGLVDSQLMPAYVGLLVAFSFGASYVAGVPWYTYIAFYVAYMLAFYAWHVQAHNRFWYIPFNGSCTSYHREASRGFGVPQR